MSINILQKLGKKRLKKCHKITQNSIGSLKKHPDWIIILTYFSDNNQQLSSSISHSVARSQVIRLISVSNRNRPQYPGCAFEPTLTSIKLSYLLKQLGLFSHIRRSQPPVYLSLYQLRKLFTTPLRRKVQ